MCAETPEAENCLAAPALHVLVDTECFDMKTVKTISLNSHRMYLDRYEKKKNLEMYSGPVFTQYLFF